MADTKWNHINIKNFASKTTKQSRKKYTTPCDRCSRGKKKCDNNFPCMRCKRMNVECTLLRFEKNQNNIIEDSKSTDSNANNHDNFNKHVMLGTEEQIISADKLIPLLLIYKEYYYGNWPIVSISRLVKRLRTLEPNNKTIASEENILCYSLCCALGGTIAFHLSFLKSESPIDLKLDIKPIEFVNESIRTRNLLNYRSLPSLDNVLTSYFLFICYVCTEGGITTGLVYMKEAITFTQLLRLHDPNIYKAKPPAEIHTLTKVYYMLLITERFMCIEENIPVTLESTIPLPTLNGEEFPNFLLGFIELLKIFSIPNRNFFDNLINYYSSSPNLESVGYQNTNGLKLDKNMIINIQNQLNTIKINYASSETQSINIIVSKHWMRALVWNISLKKALLNPDIRTSQELCLSIYYPIQIAIDFLENTKGLSVFAFESNGPGTCVKLLEIAHGVAEAINWSNNLNALGILRSIFDMVSKFKNDISIPESTYLKIKNLIIKKSSHLSISNNPMIQWENTMFHNFENSYGIDELYSSFQIPSLFNSPKYCNVVELDLPIDLPLYELGPISTNSSRNIQELQIDCNKKKTSLSLIKQ